MSRQDGAPILRRLQIQIDEFMHRATVEQPQDFTIDLE
jgi:hypothetical protein